MIHGRARATVSPGCQYGCAGLELNQDVHVVHFRIEVRAEATEPNVSRLGTLWRRQVPAGSSGSRTAMPGLHLIATAIHMAVWRGNLTG